MKKSNIRIVIVSFLMIIIGGGLFIGGILAVGGIGAAKDALAKHGVYIDHGFQIDMDRSSRPMKYSDMEPVYFRWEDVRCLELEAGAAEVKVFQDDSASDICVRTDGDYDIFIKNSVLFIKTRNKVKNHTLILELPSDMVFDSVDIEAGACTIEIESLETKKLDVELGAGEIIINHASVKECGLSVGMGSAEISLDGNKEDYNYDIECGAGNVEIGNESFGGLASEKRINNHADAVVEIECGMGNVIIGF